VTNLCGRYETGATSGLICYDSGAVDLQACMTDQFRGVDGPSGNNAIDVWTLDTELGSYDQNWRASASAMDAMVADLRMSDRIVDRSDVPGRPGHRKVTLPTAKQLPTVIMRVVIAASLCLIAAILRP
jgi:hypothetical protein